MANCITGKEGSLYPLVPLLSYIKEGSLSPFIPLLSSLKKGSSLLSYLQEGSLSLFRPLLANLQEGSISLFRPLSFLSYWRALCFSSDLSPFFLTGRLSFSLQTSPFFLTGRLSISLHTSPFFLTGRISIFFMCLLSFLKDGALSLFSFRSERRALHTVHLLSFLKETKHIVYFLMIYCNLVTFSKIRSERVLAGDLLWGICATLASLGQSGSMPVQFICKLYKRV